MADVNANIDINIDSSNAVANLRRLELAINDYQRNIASANTAAANSSAALNRALVDGINNTGMFSAKIAPATDSVGRFTTALEKNKLSLGEYTKYAASQLPGLSRVFRREFDTMQQVAESRVKKMQTQYLALGQTVDGTARSISMIPRGLAPGYATDVALATQRHQMLNKMIDDGSTKLLNWGKNTQWAGRQLMVGFSIPLAALGVTASKTFMEIDKATTSLKRVYGDLSTTSEEVDKNIAAINALGKEYTKYGVALSDTVNVAATAAAAGMRNEQLAANTKESLRLATLGQIDYQQALTTTITLQNAFGTSNKELAPTVDFIGAVANQTVLSVDDLTAAIPRVAPVIKGLGGDVKDLAVLLVAMREGGVSAEQGANALKSGLANLINPTKAASAAAAQYGIDLKGIISANRGDLMGTIKSLGSALSSLDSFSRQQVLEKVFGKYQFARIGALFDHINEKTGQVKQAMDLLGMSTEDLAAVSEKSLTAISESTTVKFQAALEQLKISIAPLGQAFLKGITPIVNMVSKVADAFNNLPDGVKNAAAVIIAAVAGIGPILLMTVGLLANGFANIIKVIQVFRKGLAGLRGDGDSFKYLSTAELEANAATNALEGSVQSLTGKLLLQKNAVNSLTQEYLRFVDVAGVASAVGGFEGFSGIRAGAPSRGLSASAKVAAMRPLPLATGGIVPGTGNKDTIPALLTPGESVITKEATAKYAPILHQMNKGTLPGFATGGVGLISATKRLLNPKDLGWKYFVSDRSAPQTMKANAASITGGYTDELFKDILGLGLGRKPNGQELKKLFDRLYYSGTSGEKIKSGFGAAMSIAHIENLGRNRSGYKQWDYENTRLTSGLENSALNDLFKSTRSKNFFLSKIQDLSLTKEDQQILTKIIKNGRHPSSIKEYKLLENLLVSSRKSKDFQSLYRKNSNNYLYTDFLIGVSRARRAETLTAKKLIKKHGEDPYALFTGEPLTFGQTVEKKINGYALGGISIGQALRTWQTSARQVRENPELLAALTPGYTKIKRGTELFRGTTFGLAGGSEFSPEDHALIFDALRTGNYEKIIGREFLLSGPLSYSETLGGTQGALASNADVSRINSLINQLYQRKNRRINDLKMLARARKNLAAGIMPELNQKRIQELEQKTEKTVYLAEQKRLQQQIKEIAPKGYQQAYMQQHFMGGEHSLLDVNLQNRLAGQEGTFMGKDVSREKEFIAPASKVRIYGVEVDPSTGIPKLLVQTEETFVPGARKVYSGYELLKPELDRRNAIHYADRAGISGLLNNKKAKTVDLISLLSNKQITLEDLSLMERNFDYRWRNGASGSNERLQRAIEEKRAKLNREPLKMATGGIVPGIGNKDTVPALLTPGESVINKKATQKYAPILHQMNQGTLRGFALGDEDIQSIRRYGSTFHGTIREELPNLALSTEELQKEFERLAAAEAAAEASATKLEEFYLQQNKGMALTKNQQEAVAQAREVNRAHIVEVQDKSNPESWTKDKWVSAPRAQNQMSQILKDSERNREIYLKELDKLQIDENKAASIRDKVNRGLQLSDDELNIQNTVLKNILTQIESGAIKISDISKKFRPWLVATVEATSAMSQNPMPAPPSNRPQANSVLAQSGIDPRRNLSKQEINRIFENRAKENLRNGPMYLPGFPSAGLLGKSMLDVYRAQQEQSRIDNIRAVRQAINEQRAQSAPARQAWQEAYRTERVQQRFSQTEELQNAANARAVNDNYKYGGLRKPSAAAIRTSELMQNEEYRKLREQYQRDQRETYKNSNREEAEAQRKANQEKFMAERKRIADEARRQVSRENPRRFSRFLRGGGGAAMGASAALGVASMIPMMAQDKEGKFMGIDAGTMSLGLGAAGGILPMLPMLGPAAAPVAAIAAVAGGLAIGLKVWRNNVDNAARETARLGSETGGTANALNTMAAVLGKQTPAQRSMQMQLGLSKEQAQTANEVVAPILQTEQGQKLISDLQSMTSTERFTKLSDYVKTAVASGMMDAAQADIFAKAVGAQLKDAILGINVSQLIKKQGVGASALLSMAESRVTAVQSAMQDKNNVKAQDRNFAIGSSLQIIQDFANTAAMANEQQKEGKITFQAYMDIVRKSTDAQNKYSDSLNNAIKNSSDIGGTAQALNSQLGLMGVTEEQQNQINKSIEVGNNNLVDMGILLAGAITMLPTAGFVGSKNNERVQIETERKGVIAEAVAGGMQADQAAAIMAYIKENPQSRAAAAYQNALNNKQSGFIALQNAGITGTVETMGVAGLNKIEQDKYLGVLQNYGKNFGNQSELQTFFASIKEELRSSILKKFSEAGLEQQKTIVSSQERLGVLGTENQQKVFESAQYQNAAFGPNASIEKLNKITTAYQDASKVFSTEQLSAIIDFQIHETKNGEPTDAAYRIPELTKEAQDIKDNIPEEMLIKLGIDISSPADLDRYGPMAASLGQDWDILQKLNPNIDLTLAAEYLTTANGKALNPEEVANRVIKLNDAWNNLNSTNPKVKKQALIEIATAYLGGNAGTGPGKVNPEDVINDLRKQFKDFDKLDPITQTQLIQIKDKVINQNAEINAKIFALNADLKDAETNEDYRKAASISAQIANLQRQANANEDAAKGELLVTRATGSPSTSGGSGGGSPNFTQKLIKETKANTSLFVKAKGAPNGLLQQFKNDFRKKAGFNLPQTILDQIGVGVEGENNLTLLKKMGIDKFVAFIKKYLKSLAGQASAAIDDEITANNKKVEAIRSMKAAGYSEDQVQAALASDSFMQEFDAMGNTAKGAQGLRSQLDRLTASQKAATDASMTAEQALQNQRDAMQNDADIINNALAKQEDQIKIDNAAKFLADNGMTTDEMHHQIDANNRIIQQEQDKINAKQSQIDSLNRQNELNNRISDALSHDLETMSQQEQKIRETYQERINALNKVAEINDHIAQQQQDQIGLSKALSEGDVYAAAQAAQQMQQNQVEYARKQQQDALQTGMQNAVDNLRTPSGLTRKQAEQQINSIKEQSYQISLKVRDIQDEIYNIQNGQMKTLQDQNEQYSRKLQYNDEDLQYQLDTTDFHGHSRKWWQEHLTYLSNAMTNTNGLGDAMQRLIGLMNQYNAGRPTGSNASSGSLSIAQQTAQAAAAGMTYGVATSGGEFQLGGTDPNHVPGPDYGWVDGLGWTTGYANGGIVPKKYASGGHINMDSVPAMLTPGEFVMRKAAVHKYGIGALSDMNTGRWDIPKYNTGKLYASTPKVGSSSRGNMQNNISAPVYNTYSINVPVNQPGASADEIANKVMMKIKNIENSSIRRIGGY
jgi:TP901 family phage tail tape measure protein